MRSIGLFNLVYGTTGLVSSLKLDRVDGGLVSMWIILCGAVAYLGLAPGRAAFRNLLARIRP